MYYLHVPVLVTWLSVPCMARLKPVLEIHFPPMTVALSFSQLMGARRHPGPRFQALKLDFSRVMSNIERKLKGIQGEESKVVFIPSPWLRRYHWISVVVYDNVKSNFPCFEFVFSHSQNQGNNHGNNIQTLTTIVLDNPGSHDDKQNHCCCRYKNLFYVTIDILTNDLHIHSLPLFVEILCEISNKPTTLSFFRTEAPYS